MLSAVASLNRLAKRINSSMMAAFWTESTSSVIPSNLIRILDIVSCEFLRIDSLRAGRTVEESVLEIVSPSSSPVVDATETAAPGTDVHLARILIIKRGNVLSVCGFLLAFSTGFSTGPLFTTPVSEPAPRRSSRPTQVCMIYIRSLQSDSFRSNSLIVSSAKMASIRSTINSSWTSCSP
jgi:hypothetical protein